MATRTVLVTTDWTLVVPVAAASFLLTTSDEIEVAATVADETTPTVTHGHAVGASLGLTRNLIGDGAVWARAPRGALVVVT